MVSVLFLVYIDIYFNSMFVVGYVLVLWFYEFGVDNWFSWERIQELIIVYFLYYDGYFWEMELKLFKGFNQLGIICFGIMFEDLLVVVNWLEKVIILWFFVLYD